MTEETNLALSEVSKNLNDMNNTLIKILEELKTMRESFPENASTSGIETTLNKMAEDVKSITSSMFVVEEAHKEKAIEWQRKERALEDQKK